MCFPNKTQSYAGIVNAYVLNRSSSGNRRASESAANTVKGPGIYGYQYNHALFVADYNVAGTSWDSLSSADLILGTDHTSGGITYTLRAPTASNSSKSTGGTQHGITNGMRF